MNLSGNVFITGGAGYLARGIYARARCEQWPCRFTCLSRDDHKHAALQRDFPEVRCIRGDVSFGVGELALAMLGHETVIHAAASKHVDLCEANVWDTYRVNVDGSRNVAQAAVQAGVSKVIGISTDKACKPVTAYGHSKAAMERLFLEADTWTSETAFSVVRYGNVISSTGSVLPTWKAMLAKDGYVTATDPDMTRFWMSLDEAIDAILLSLEYGRGAITIYKARALSMYHMRQYLMPDAEFHYRGLRSIEKIHEDLLAQEESDYAYLESDEVTIKLNPNKKNLGTAPYASSAPRAWLTQEELLEMLK